MEDIIDQIGNRLVIGSGDRGGSDMWGTSTGGIEVLDRSNEIDEDVSMVDWEGEYGDEGRVDESDDGEVVSENRNRQGGLISTDEYDDSSVPNGSSSGVGGNVDSGGNVGSGVGYSRYWPGIVGRSGDAELFPRMASSGFPGLVGEHEYEDDFIGETSNVSPFTTVQWLGVAVVTGIGVLIAGDVIRMRGVLVGKRWLARDACYSKWALNGCSRPVPALVSQCDEWKACWAVEPWALWGEAIVAVVSDTFSGMGKSKYIVLVAIVIAVVVATVIGITGLVTMLSGSRVTNKHHTRQETTQLQLQQQQQPQPQPQTMALAIRQ